jgi:transcriptional regulator with XRE-family HTH domain
MGRTPRDRPKRLGRKLLQIRQRLGMSQTEMSKALGLKVHYSAVSNFEHGSREPDLLIVLKYARLARVPMETLVDDKMKLP